MRNRNDKRAQSSGAEWEKRLAAARAQRQKIQSDPAPQSGKDNTQPASPPANKNAGSTTANDRPDVSVQDVLNTRNLNDRMEMARLRHAQVLAKRTPQSPENPGGPDRTAIAGQDTMRAAFGGGMAAKTSTTEPAPDPAPQKADPVAPVAAAPVVAPDQTAPVERRRSKAVTYATIVVILLLIAVAVPGPFRNLVGTSTLQVLALVSPSSAPPQTAQEPVETGLPAAPQVAAVPEVAAEPEVAAAPEPEVVTEPEVAAAPVQITESENQPAPVVTPNETTVVAVAGGVPPRVGDFLVPRFTAPVTAPAAAASVIANSVQGVDLRPSAVPLLNRSGPDQAPPRSLAAAVPNYALAARSEGAQPEPTIKPIARPSLDAPRLALNVADGFGPATTGAQADDNLTAPQATDGQAPVQVPASTLSAQTLPDVGKFDVPGAPVLAPVLNVSVPASLAAPKILPEVGSLARLNQPQRALFSPQIDEPTGVSAPAIETSTPGPFEPVLLGSQFQINDILLHAPTGIQQQQVANLVDALQSNGFPVGDPRQVSFTISRTNIRYFHAADADAARALSDVIDGQVRNFTDFRPSPPRGTIEVYIAGNSPSRPRTSNSPPRSSGEDPALLLLRNRLVDSLRRGDHL